MSVRRRGWAALARRRISRRRALAAGIGGAAAGALALAGCDGGGGGDVRDALEVAATPGPPRHGGVLRIGTALPIASGLDPQLETGAGLAIFPRLYGYTHHVYPDDESIVLDHAASVEQPDETTYVIQLRDGVRFAGEPPASGRAVDAHDVAATVARYRHNALVIDKLWHDAVLDAAVAYDDRTVFVTTRRPFAYSLGELGAIGAGAIIPRELADVVDISRIAAGSGPFVLDEYSSSRVRIVRTSAYFAEPLPYLDAMEWRFYASHDEKVAALEAGDVDLVPHRDRAEATAFRNRDEFEVVTEPALSSLAVGVRVDVPPFADPRVREALDIALDRATLIRDIAQGDGAIVGPVNRHLAGGFWALPDDELRAAYATADAIDERRVRARQLLEEAGHDGAAFELQAPDTPEMLDAASAVREQFRRIGLNVDVQAVDELGWFVNFRRGKYQATLINHRPYESPDFPMRLYHSVGPDATGNPFGFSDGRVDRLIERSWGEFDRERRRESLLEAQRLVLAARPSLQLFSGAGWTTARSYVRDWRSPVGGSFAQYVYGQWLDVAAEEG